MKAGGPSRTMGVQAGCQDDHSLTGEWLEATESKDIRSLRALPGSDGVNRNEAGIPDKEMLAPRHGFEPRFTAPKAAVLPLDDRGR